MSKHVQILLDNLFCIPEIAYQSMTNLGLTFATSAILIQVMSSKSVTDSLLFTKTMKVAFCDVMLVESGENGDAC